MLMMRLAEYVQSLDRTAALARAFQGQEIRERGGKEMQLMLMMLALQRAESGSNCCTCQGFARPGDWRERWKGNPADADDARVAAP